MVLIVESYYDLINKLLHVHPSFNLRVDYAHSKKYVIEL